MNWKLVGTLSLFGFAMSLGTISVISSTVEPLVWLPILLFCAFVIGRAHHRPFRHGVAVGLANSVWMTSAHILFAPTYMANHPQEAAMMANMPIPGSPRLMMLIVGPLAGLVSGVVIGVLAVIADKVTRPKVAAA